MFQMLAPSCSGPAARLRDDSDHWIGNMMIAEFPVRSAVTPGHIVPVSTTRPGRDAPCGKVARAPGPGALATWPSGNRDRPGPLDRTTGPGPDRQS